MARQEQREAMLRVLREHVADRIADGAVDRVDDLEVQDVADAMLDAGCVMADAVTDAEGFDAPGIGCGKNRPKFAREWLRAISKEEK